MPTSTYRPDLMGTATLEPAGVFEAGSWQSFTLVYTAGPFGVDDTGSIKIGFRFATDFGPVQFTDPKAPGYTTVEASNGATLDAKWEFKRNIRPWSRSLYIGVVKDFLAPGDTITIRFGDRRHGSPGHPPADLLRERVRVPRACRPDRHLRLRRPAESPRSRSFRGPACAGAPVLPTLVRAGEPFRLSVKVDDKWGNPSDVVDRTLQPRRRRRRSPACPRRARFVAGQFGAIVEGLRIDEPGERMVRVLDEKGEELCRSNPLRVVAGRHAALVHFWGDTHGQSNETLGTNTAREYFEFGRDKAFLDVMGHQGNDFQITGAFWRELNALTRRVRQARPLRVHPGLRVVGQHRGRRRPQRALPPRGRDHPPLLARPDRRCDRHRRREHPTRTTRTRCSPSCAARTAWWLAHVGGRYADIKFAHDPLETAVEVHSAWGTFEWIVRDAFEKGYRVGIVANSDGHKGRPGACYPGASFFGSYGGLTCFLAERLDRDAIFECMRRRRHYATTGNRALLERVGGAGERGAEVLPARSGGWADARPSDTRRLIMGDIARVADDEVDLAIEVVGSAPIERLDIYDGLDLIETVRPYGADRPRRPRAPRLRGRRIPRPRAHHHLGRLARPSRATHRAHGRHQQLEPRSRHPAPGRNVAWPGRP